MKMSFNLNQPGVTKILDRKRTVYLLLFIFLFISCHKDDHDGKDDSRNCEEFKKEKKSDKDEKNGEPTVSVFATGFNNPRGLKFGPDCYLYVAEAGLGGTTQYYRHMSGDTAGCRCRWSFSWKSNRGTNIKG